MLPNWPVVHISEYEKGSGKTKPGLTMKRYDLSILIPARNEMFLARTVEDILTNKRGATEILVGLDGQWADPPIPDHKDVTIVYFPKSIGQRAVTNKLCQLSKAKYVMKLDAHCALDEGFDVKLMADMQDDWTVIPAMYNLHVFDWVCGSCQHRIYQGPTPEKCPSCGGVMTRDIIWKPRLSRRSEFYRFDTTLHFQYHGKRKDQPDAQGDIAETMSAQGSCFMLTRAKYWELDICDEKFGSWGQQGAEVACKTWLSGGRLVTNKKTYYAHMFRTQGGDFGFPYPLSGKDVEHARKYSRDLFMENTWHKQIHPLSWLIEKFAPLNNGAKDGVPDWHDPEGKAVLDMVSKKGEEFYAHRKKMMARDIASQIKSGAEAVGATTNDTFYLDDEPYSIAHEVEPRKGIIYYTDNQLNLKIAHAAKKWIRHADLPIVSASLKPMDFGKNIHMAGYKRGYEAYFRQILAALEASDADIIYFCEHDWLYHPSHFDFTPPRKDTFYYNVNWWRVRSYDGFAVRYDTQLLPGIVAYRDILLEHYRAVVGYLWTVGFTAENANQVGFEPGTSKRVDLGVAHPVEHFESEYPIIDIRHGANLTASKWSQDAFRSQKNCQNWRERDASEIPGWSFKRGDFIGSL